MREQLASAPRAGSPALRLVVLTVLPRRHRLVLPAQRLSASAPTRSVLAGRPLRRDVRPRGASTRRAPARRSARRSSRTRSSSSIRSPGRRSSTSPAAPPAAPPSLYGLTCLAGAILIGPRGAFVAALAGALLLLAALRRVRLRRHRRCRPISRSSAYVDALGDIGYPLFVNLLVLMRRHAARRATSPSACASPAGDLEEATAARRGGRAPRRARAPRRRPRARDPQPARLHRRLDRAARAPADALGEEEQTPLRDRRARDGAPERSGRATCSISSRPRARLRPRRPRRDRARRRRARRAIGARRRRRGALRGPRRGDVRAADAAQLRQVVWNLVRNAIQASSPGARGQVRIVGERRESAERRCSRCTTTGPASRRGAGAALRRVLHHALARHGHRPRGGEAHRRRPRLPIEVESQEGRGATFRVRMGG